MILNLCIRNAKITVFLFFALLAGFITRRQSVAAELDATTGILVVTPDRGFLGNQEIGDGFDLFAAGRNADILYVVDARSKTVLHHKLDRLTEKGAKQIIVLPLFISSVDARWQQAKSWLQGYSRNNLETIQIAEPYGTSYLAVEDLSDRLRQTPTDKKRLLLIGYGATDAESAKQMKSELKRMGEFASILSGEDIQVTISPARGAADVKALREQYNAAIKDSSDALVTPVLLAFRADSMMSFVSSLTHSVPKGAQLVTSTFSTPSGLQQWMDYATNQALLRSSATTSANVGAIALAHGSDWFWNQAIRDALAPTAKNIPVVFTFSMADQPTIERAVREMEKKHVRGIVLVRIFGQASSFYPTVSRMIGADIQSGTHAGHDHSMMGHGDHGEMHGGSHGDHTISTLAASPRIRTNLPIVSVGGVEDSSYFAKALLANARSISTDPSRETIILTAHGAGADSDNDRWIDILNSLSQQMKKEEDYNFKEIRYVTWREDWPKKSAPELAKAREWVQEINQAGGRVLIVPARTNGRGAADRYLKGLNFGWSQGFAQTPYFNAWFADQVKIGTQQLTEHPATIAQPAPVQAHHH